MATESVSKKRRWPAWATIVAVFLLLVLIVVGFVFIEVMGMGGWEPNKDSPYAQRARSIDAKMHSGMGRQAVKGIFQADIAANPSDSTEDTSNAYWGRGVPTWPLESDLYIIEPRPHF